MTSEPASPALCVPTVSCSLLKRKIGCKVIFEERVHHINMHNSPYTPSLRIPVQVYTLKGWHFSWKVGFQWRKRWLSSWKITFFASILYIRIRVLARNSKTGVFAKTVTFQLKSPLFRAEEVAFELKSHFSALILSIRIRLFVLLQWRHWQ